MPGSDEWTVRCVGSTEEFLALEQDWDSLAAGALQTVFLTHWWLSVWLATYGDAYRLKVLTAWQDRRLVAALPLVTDEPVRRIRRWQFMGSGTLTPNHLDVIACPEDREKAVHAFTAFMLDSRDDWDVLELDKVPADSGMAEVISASAGAAGLPTSVALSAVCPYADLPETFDEYLASLSKSTRKHIKQNFNRLRRSHPDTEFHRAGRPDEVDRAMEELHRMHQARWQRKGHAGNFADPDYVRFHGSAAGAALRKGALRVYTLAAGDTLMAVTYAFRTGATVESYLSSFDERWATYGLSSLLTAHVIQDSIAEGVRHFDYLQGQESYKASWCPLERQDSRLRVFNRTLTGRVALARDSAVDGTILLGRRLLPAEVREAILKRVKRPRMSRQH